MQVKVWDAAFGDLDAELAGCPTYFAWTPVFTMTPGTFSYPSITSDGGTTWQETPIVIGLWNLDPPWPVIQQQPQSQTVSSGSSATFFVRAFADMRAMYYQWYKDGVAITNATSPAYTIASASLADEGLYSVDVYNPVITQVDCDPSGRKGCPSRAWRRYSSTGRPCLRKVEI